VWLIKRGIPLFTTFIGRKGLFMSISPKVVERSKQDFTTFHMRVSNNTDKDIEGYIRYVITMPDGKIDVKEFDRIEHIKANSEVNTYDKYYIYEYFPTGRYVVDGRFYYNGFNILSDTKPNDYFDVI